MSVNKVDYSRICFKPTSSADSIHHGTFGEYCVIFVSTPNQTFEIISGISYCNMQAIYNSIDFASHLCIFLPKMDCVIKLYIITSLNEALNLGAFRAKWCQARNGLDLMDWT